MMNGLNKKLSILVMDPDSKSGDFFTALIRQDIFFQKAELCFIENPDEGSKLLIGKKFDLIISEAEMWERIKPKALPSSSKVILMGEEKAPFELSGEFFLKKPLSAQEVKRAVQLVFSREKRDFTAFEMGSSPVWRKTLKLLKQVSGHDCFVLITGGSGTGKEFSARYIHEHSRRRGGPFVALTGSAVSEPLIESEIFGHKKGAFTGALSDKKGLMKEADGGTFFLDEIGDLPLNLQPKLLRALQESRFRPLGGLDEEKVSLRVISSSNRNLKKRMKEGFFREDLFHRLAVIQIHLPALRERREDIIPLAEFFLKENKKKHSKKNLKFSEEALSALQEFSFPGNIRELSNKVERAVLLASGERIEKKDLLYLTEEKEKNQLIPFPLLKNLSGSKGVDLDFALREIEKSILSEAFKRFPGKRAQAAEFLKITPRSLKHRIKKYKLSS